MILLFSTLEGRPKMSDVSLLRGIPGLSFDSRPFHGNKIATDHYTKNESIDLLLQW